MSRPILRTFAETYLTRRGLDPAHMTLPRCGSIPHCYCRDSDEAPRRGLPAIIAAVTDSAGLLTDVHRTWLDPANPCDKAPVRIFLAARWRPSRSGRPLRLCVIDRPDRDRGRRMAHGPPLHREAKQPPPCPPPLTLRPPRSRFGGGGPLCPPLVRPEGRKKTRLRRAPGAAPMRNDRDDEFEPIPRCSPTARLLEELQLNGHRPHEDEPDPRPLPDQRAVEAALADAFDALVSVLADTRLEPDLEDLLWSTVNLFHRAAAQVGRRLDRNEDEQKRSQAELDGSEIRSVELVRRIAEGTMIERRNAFEAFRDCAADLFEAHIGSA